MPIRLLCLFLSLSWTSLVAADIFKSVDKNGKVIYTDTPPGNQPVERVTLPPINTLPPENTSQNYTQSQEPEEQEVNYSVRIISPRADVVIPPGQRDLGIAVTLAPNLQPDHWLLYFMNGELLEETQSNNIIVQEVFRGNHTIVVEVIDNKGVSLGKSDPVVVNVIRPTIKPVTKPNPGP